MQYKIRFYDITKCGYFSENKRKLLFGSVDNLLTDLQKWTSGKKLSETQLFNAKEDTEQLTIYCANIQNNTSGDSIIQIWNGTPTNLNNQTMAINGNANVGTKIDVKTSDFDKEYIPGFDTYFWFPKGFETYATIRSYKTNTGRKNFDFYLDSFLRKKLPIKISLKDEKLYYMNDKEIDIVIPMFRSQARFLRGDFSYILNNYKNISSFIRSFELTKTCKEDLALWERVTRFFIQDTGLHKTKCTVKTILPWNPSLDELNKLIKNWKTEINIEGNLGKTGVNIKKEDGGSETVWFDAEVARYDLELDVKLDSNGIFNMEQLASLLDKNRKEILNNGYLHRR